MTAVTRGGMSSSCPYMHPMLVKALSQDGFEEIYLDFAQTFKKQTWILVVKGEGLHDYEELII